MRSKPLRFSSITGVTKTLAVAKILAGVRGSKEGYTIKSITLVSSNTTASAKVSGTTLTFTKPGNIVFNLVLKHASKEDATIKNCKIIISKDAAATLTFNRVSKAFGGGSFTTSEILGGVAGTKSGYTLKEIKTLVPSDVASVTGTKPKLSLRMTKIGSFTATIVLEHSTKGDVTITGAEFKISTSAGERLTFGKLTKVYSSGGRFTTAEILGRVGGTKAGYTLREIRSLNPTGVASVTGTKPSLSLSHAKAGSFTATLVLEHATKGDSTIDNASFEITKASAPTLTWTKQSKPYGSGGEISNAELLAGLNGTTAAKTGYTIKSVTISSANGTGARVSGTGTSAKIVGYTKVGNLTLTLVFQHPAKVDVTLTGKAFEITKGRAASLTWRKQTKVYSSGGEITHAQLLAGVQGSKTGYTIKTVTISNDGGTSAVVSGSGRAAKITSYNKVGTLTLTLVLAHPSKEDVTLTGKSFEITKARAETLTFSKRAKSFSVGGSFSTSEILAGVVGTKDGYTLKEIKNVSPSGFARVNGTKPNLSLAMIKVGSFRATICLEHPTKADATITGTTFEMKNTWEKVFGGSKDDESRSIVQTSDGGFAVLGTTKSKGLGVGDIWLLKLNDLGNKTWEKTFGGSKDEAAEFIVQTSDGGFVVVGYTYSKGLGANDGWVLKLDASGGIVWEKTFGGRNFDSLSYVVQTSDGGFAVVGYTSSKGSGGDDLWVLKLDSSGDKTWEKLFGGSYDDTANSIVQTSDGGFAVMGTIQNTSSSDDKDLWLLKLNASGNKTWEKTFGGRGREYPKAIVQMSDGSFVIAADKDDKISMDFDVWILKLNPSGNKTWEKTFGGSKWDSSYSIVQTSDGGFAVVGYTESKGSGDKDGWLLKLDASGDKTWEKVFGWSEKDVFHSIVQTSDGGFAITGYTHSKGAARVADVWVLKLDENGEL